MYIEEIVLEGFKSYAQRVVLKDFDKHFNAITGFNGYVDCAMPNLYSLIVEEIWAFPSMIYSIYIIDLNGTIEKLIFFNSYIYGYKFEFPFFLTFWL